MKVLLLVNASASSVTARGRVVIQKALSADHEVTTVETNRRGHATRLARSAAGDGTEVVVVLGGDGTLNEAANGLAGTATALAPLPGGSTNVFSRTIGLPDDTIEACGVLLEALSAGSIRRVGLGSVNGRYFLFHVGMGFDAAIVEQVERRGELKRWLSHPLFLYCTFSAWFRHFDHSRPRMSVHHLDGSVVDDSYFSLVFNTNPYTFLGTRPLRIAPEATLDSALTVASVRSLRFFTITALGLSALGSGRHIHRSRAVDYRADVPGCTIRGHGPFPYQVDGDFLGETEELLFRHEPAVLDLVLPPT